MKKESKIVLGVGGGLLGVAGIGAGFLVYLSKRANINITDIEKLKWAFDNLDLALKGLNEEVLDKFIYYSDLYGIPVAIPLAMAETESKFNPRCYNPEIRKGKYVTYEKLTKELIYTNPRIAEFYYNSPDRGDKTKWGSYGYFQLVPHYSLRFGSEENRLKVGEPNSVLFDIDRQLDIGIDRMARLWHRYGNAADVRAKWGRNMTVEQAINEYLNKGERYHTAKSVLGKILGRFLCNLRKYEKRFGKVKHFANKEIEDTYHRLCHKIAPEYKREKYCDC